MVIHLLLALGVELGRGRLALSLLVTYWAHALVWAADFRARAPGADHVHDCRRNRHARFECARGSSVWSARRHAGQPRARRAGTSPAGSGGGQRALQRAARKRAPARSRACDMPHRAGWPRWRGLPATRGSRGQAAEIWQPSLADRSRSCDPLGRPKGIPNRSHQRTARLRLPSLHRA